MNQPLGQGEASWYRGAATLLGLLGVLAWLLQLREVFSFRTGFLCNLGILLFLAGCLSREGPAPRPLFERRGQLALLLLVVACGILTRTIALDRFPPADGQLWEETQTGKVAYDSLRFGSLDPYFPLTNLAAELGFRLFGISMTTLRLPFVGLGIVSIPLFFLAARFFFRTFAAALMVTALFAASAYLSSAARVALETMAPIVTVCLALALTFRACVRKTTSAFAFAGIADGLLMLEYFSYKLLAPLLALFVVGCLLQGGRGAYCNRSAGSYRISHLLEYRRQLLAFAFFAAAVAIPLAILEPANPFDFFLEGFHRQQVGIDEAGRGLSVAGKLWLAEGRVVDSMRFIFLRGGQNDIVNFSRGIVDLPTGLLGLAALIYCTLRGRRCPAKLFLVGSIISFVVLSGALVGNPARYRLTPVVPLYLLTLGTAVDDLMDWFDARSYRVAILALATVGLCVLNFRVLDKDVLNNLGTRSELYDLPLRVVDEISRLQQEHPGAQIYLVSNFDYLGGVSDYEFLYDPARVTVLTSASALRGKTGYVIAHGRYVAGVAGLADTSACRSWQTPIRQDRMIRCRLGGTTAGPTVGQIIR